MEGNLRAGSRDGAALHVKTEAVDENTSALVSGSQEPHAPCGGAACRGGAGGDQLAEEQPDTELHAAATSTPVLLYPVSTERFFATSGDGKTYLKIAPAPAMPPAPSEKALPSGSDFSSKAVLCLIEAVGRRWGLYETRERSQLFQSVQEEMASKGHMLPVEKIRRKWNNLIVTYKRVKDRSRETGHAKTSWEFFDLMDATLCDTVGSQIINNKRTKGGNNGSSPSGPLAKIASKPPPPAPAPVVLSNGDFAPYDGMNSAGQGAISGHMITDSSMAAVTISPTHAPEVKPLIVLNSNIVSTSVHPASILASPSFISSPSSPPSLSSKNTAELSTPRHAGRKAPSFSSAAVSYRRSNAPLHNQNLLTLSSSFPPLSSSLVSCLPSSSGPSCSEGQNLRGSEEQLGSPGGNAPGELLKRQEEQAYLDRVARRRVEAREKRRERREVRMAESLGRIATALELLSSKQDTVIALLQRLAERK